MASRWSAARVIADAGGRRRKRIVSMAFDTVCVRGVRLRNASEIRFFGRLARVKEEQQAKVV